MLNFELVLMDVCFFIYFFMLSFFFCLVLFFVV